MENNFHHLRRLFETAMAREPADRLVLQLRLFPLLVQALTASSALQFYTLFAQISYLASRFNLPGRWSYALQVTRREMQQRQLPDEDASLVAEASLRLLLHLLEKETGTASSRPVYPLPALPALPDAMRHDGRSQPYARVIVSEWHPADKTLLGMDEKDPSTVLTIHYGVADVNELFAGTLEEAIRHMGLPLVLGLADVRYPEPAHAIPGYIVLLPDLLVPVTAVAGMIPGHAFPAAANLTGRFIPSGESISLLTGHVANLFLDELVRDPGQTYEALIRRAFREYPVMFSRLGDAETRDLTSKLRGHFETIRTVVNESFGKEAIERAHCHIEPSYFSPRFGLKGRLDLLHIAGDGGSPTIIELKSGKPFKPNHYNLNEEHYRQTLLYDLVIRSTHARSARRRNFILYSGQQLDPLRFAAPAEGLQKELIHGRNQLVLLDFLLANQDKPGRPDLFRSIHPDAYPGMKGFTRKHIQAWADVYSALPDSDKAYFKAFGAFIAREHMLASVGRDMGEGSGGVAGLWLDPVKAKEERYELLQGLVLGRTNNEAGQTIIHFNRDARTHSLANFREGDIVVMYPFLDEAHPDPTRTQLYRATIQDIDQESVIIRLRNSQVNTLGLAAGTRWNLEPDMLDSSFGKLYESLWRVMSCNPARRAVVLGKVEPRWGSVSDTAIPEVSGLTRIQQGIFEEGIRADDLYLLWGPPGTGKTSVMLRAWVRYFITARPGRILLLAYTNRAVDEICAAISGNDMPLADQYIRIGSRSGTGASYRHRLLEEVIAPCDTRHAIRHILEKTRVYVGTVSSFLGKSDLLELIRFDLAIIDEASQLLEPTITGLLTRVSKAILIGDHMQLPAVSRQSGAHGVLDKDLEWTRAYGLTDLRMSYFERLYRAYQAKGWQRAIGSLCEQGRMHRRIMEAANALVYEDGLACLDDHAQSMPFQDRFPGHGGWLTRERLAFIDVPSLPAELLAKTATGEAETVVRLLRQWLSLIKSFDLPWQIGVITPFRAQIAAILRIAHEAGLDMRGVTVDTVERYQGGARDIVIMSTVAGHPAVLDRIISANLEGYDRKLNVALTRAREQFVLIGDASVLRTASSYDKLIALCHQPDA